MILWSPVKDKNIREEAYDFLEEEVKDITPSSIDNRSRRSQVRQALQFRLDDLIKDVRTHGMGSDTYRRFRQYVDGT